MVVAGHWVLLHSVPKTSWSIHKHRQCIPCLVRGIGDSRSSAYLTNGGPHRSRNNPHIRPDISSRPSGAVGGQHNCNQVAKPLVSISKFDSASPMHLRTPTVPVHDLRRAFELVDLRYVICIIYTSTHTHTHTPTSTQFGSNILFRWNCCLPW